MTDNPQIYRFLVRQRHENDPRSAGLLADARTLGFLSIHSLECLDLFFIEGQLSAGDQGRLAAELLSDPITQVVEWGRIVSGGSAPVEEAGLWTLDVALRPGVTDPVAEQIVRAAGELGIQGVQQASSGARYRVGGEGLAEADLHSLARRLLANPVIQRYALGAIQPIFPHPAEASGLVERIPLRSLDEAGLKALSLQRRAALDLAEMQAVQAYFRRAGREPSDIEFEMIAQTWSEHCVHKTFKARVRLEQPGAGLGEINGILRTYIRAATEQIAAPWVRSAFVDNAGILDFDDEYEVSFKVETHNHPSAIEPFGGANTGVGGVIRDVLGVSAKPIAATDILCFGPQNLPLTELPEGVLHPRRIQSGVVAGVQDYGNKIGIPTVNGAILYDPGYTANPLVFCGCVGLAPKGSHPRTPLPGDRVIVLGGRTGRDGLRGATFSSMTMDAQTGEVAGASVQIGDPITEKGLIEVLVRARDQRLYHAVTDCGAGGLSSAVGEMSSECGAVIELQDVRLKYPGLAHWEIWLSEAQERMVLAVGPANLDALQEICRIYAVELTDIGVFNQSGRLVVQYAGQTILDLENTFLHDGIPQRCLAARLEPHPAGAANSLPALPAEPAADSLLRLLGSPNVASKEAVIRLYDHEVQGGTVIKPLTGAQNDGPSDACVLKPAGTRGAGGIVLSNGINPQYGKLDAYHMAFSVVDEAIRNAVAVGANPERIALLDNFCWGDPLRPETLGSLLEAARGCYEAALQYGTPFVSGKDSLNNEYLGADGLRHAIPPTLLISALGLIEDVGQAVSMDLKTAGGLLYLLGQPAAALGLPGRVDYAPALYRTLHQAMRQGLVDACHDLSEGGLGVAAAEMCIGGRLGLELDLPAGLGLFQEANGCLLVEVSPADRQLFEQTLGGAAGIPAPLLLGLVLSEPALTVLQAGAELLSLPVSRLAAAWKGLQPEVER